jgi:hypothetical protein
MYDVGAAWYINRKSLMSVQLKFGKLLLIDLKATGPHLVPRLAGTPGGESARGLAR